MKNLKRAVVSLGVTLMILYLAVCVYFYFIQDVILFKPTTLPEDHSYTYEFDFNERWFDVTDDARIHAIHAKTADSLKGLIFFMHGNAGNTETRPLRFTYFLDQGYDMLYPDYRGYGKSTGSLRNEEDLVGDMQVLYEEMSREYGEDRIVLIGYSMGSGVAAQVAAANDPAQLILWTPYYSILDLKNSSYPFLPSFLVRYPLRTDLALPKIEEPVTIFFAEEDEVLPVSQSIRLTEFLKPGDRHIILDDQGHNWIIGNGQLQRELGQILR